jgi:hypothetical protein
MRDRIAIALIPLGFAVAFLLALWVGWMLLKVAVGT